MIAGMNSIKVSVLQSIKWRHMFVMLLTVCFLSIAVNAKTIETTRPNDNMFYSGNPQGPVERVTSPTRATSYAFRHELPAGRIRSEFSGDRVPKGGTYWYGWSFRHASSPAIPNTGHTILAQWFIGDRPASSWPCGGAGHKISARQGVVVFNLQHSTSGGSDITCKTFTLASFDEVKDKWVDIVINAKWTDGTDGFVKLWIRVGGDSGQWVQKIDYKGRSQASGSEGPYFKWGVYKDSKGPRLVYTDEFTLADGNSRFEDVAPGGSGPVSTPSPTPTVSPTPNPPGCNSANGGGSWINNSFVNQTGTFTATFDATPSTSPANMHVGLSSGAQSAYSGFAAIVRFNTAGNIDARNGGAYAAASAIPYSANTKYSFRVVVNVPAHTYSVYVTPAGGTERTVGENFAFRTEQASVSQLNNYGSYVEGSSGSLQVCNFQIGGGGPTTLINEDCSSIANFTRVSGGTWASTNGQCTLTAAATCTSPLCNILTHNSVVSGDFTLTAGGVAAASSNTWDDFAIIFGYQDASNYYYAIFNENDDAATNGIFRVQGGVKTQIVDFGSNLTDPSSTLYNIKIERAGNSVKVYRGNLLLGTAADASFASGKVGFGSYNNNATFDNLKVTKP